MKQIKVINTNGMDFGDNKQSVDAIKAGFKIMAPDMDFTVIAEHTGALVATKVNGLYQCWFVKYKTFEYTKLCFKESLDYFRKEVSK